jgi:DNA-binding NarL/FixJ family response regulator
MATKCDILHSHSPNKPTTFDDMNTHAVGILLVDDHRLIRVGMKAALESLSPRPVRVLEAACLMQAIEVVKTHANDIDFVVLDLNLPDSKGLTGLQTIKQLHPRACTVVISAVSDEVLREEALSLGASGFFHKATESGGIDDLLRLIGAWRPLNSSASTSTMTFKLPAPGTHQSHLTPRETEVLDLILQGKSNQEIADCTQLKLGYVKNIVSSLYVVFGVNSRAKLIHSLR